MIEGCVVGPLAVKSVRSRGEAQRATTTGAGRSTGPLIFQPVPWEGERPVPPRPGEYPDRRGDWNDAEAGMPLAEASGAICVQKLDDSRNSAIHIRYRISLRSSSLWEPRYPLLRVVIFRGRPCVGCAYFRAGRGLRTPLTTRKSFPRVNAPLGLGKPGGGLRLFPGGGSPNDWSPDGLHDRFNDPSAGSPTETLLRLLLPCRQRVQGSSDRR